MIGAWEWNISDEHVRWSPITREIHEVPDDYAPSLEGGIAFYTGTSRQTILELIHIAVNSGKSSGYRSPDHDRKGKCEMGSLTR
ncbi:MAG: hypothetical protein QM743_00480 [Chitinophagaceae bacterium]